MRKKHIRCKMLNSNPVLVALHFKYGVEVFFKEIVIDGPLGKMSYYAIRINFQGLTCHAFILSVDSYCSKFE